MDLGPLQPEKSILYLACTLLAVALGILYPRWRRRAETRAFKNRNGCKDPPQYPHTDRIHGSDLGRLRAEAFKNGGLFKLYQSLFEQCGKTFEEIFNGKVIINTIEPENIQQVTSVAFGDYGKDPGRMHAQSPFLGPSIFSDGPIWKPSRALVSPIFSRAELSDLDHLASFTDRFLELIPDDGATIDMQPLLNRLFLDVSVDFLIGRSLGALQPEMPPESVEFLEAFGQAQRWIAKRREAGWRRYLYDYDKEWIATYRKAHRLIDREVERALRETKDVSPNPDTTQRQRYVLLDEMAKQIRDPIQLRYQILGVFLPSRDSTSTAVANTLFQLARHPEWWVKLRKISLDLGDEPITLEKINSLAEFRHVLLETIRVCGPAARVWRVAIRDTVLPSGGGPDRKSPVFVPKDTPVVLGTWCVQHDRDLWGDDAEEFKPDRWIGRTSKWDFVPFSRGPRQCPARQQIFTHVIYTLIKLTQRFEVIENRDPIFEYVEKVTVTVTNKTGVQVAFKRPR